MAGLKSLQIMDLEKGVKYKVYLSYLYDGYGKDHPVYGEVWDIEYVLGNTAMPFAYFYVYDYMGNMEVQSFAEADVEYESVIIRYMV
jgi:hypothetical protein